MDTAVVLGHEAELAGFGLHFHRSFAGHLVIPLRSTNLEHRIMSVREEAWEVLSQASLSYSMIMEKGYTPGPH